MLTSIRTANVTRLSGLVAALLVAAACSSGGGATTAPTTAPTAAESAAPTAAASSAPSEAASTEPSAAAGGAMTLTVATSATAGKYLAGADGKTLYVFSLDTPNKSACTGSCATNWPPLTVAAGGSGPTATDATGTLATFARDDGTTQVSYNGKPLYYFANDKAAGDTNGQGVAGKWTVAAP
jgi:predicted lipoprotein with Yx(FWY)xxD motif